MRVCTCARESCAPAQAARFARAAVARPTARASPAHWARVPRALRLVRHCHSRRTRAVCPAAARCWPRAIGACERSTSSTHARAACLRCRPSSALMAHAARGSRSAAALCRAFAPVGPRSSRAVSGSRRQARGWPGAAGSRRLVRATLLLAGLVATLGHTPRPPAAPLAPKYFATSISGEGGPPIEDTPVGTTGTSTLQLYYLNNVDPLATCNDGSPAGYYFAPGSGSMANYWLVYLEGSMFCWDIKSCQERYTTHGRVPRYGYLAFAHRFLRTRSPFRYWMSSTTPKQWATSFAQGGIFATDGSSAWGTANRVYVKCVVSVLRSQLFR